MNIQYTDNVAICNVPDTGTAIECGDPVYTTNFCGDDLVVVDPRGYPPVPQEPASWQPATPETAKAARVLVVRARLKGIGGSDHVFHFANTPVGIELKQTFPCIR